MCNTTSLAVMTTEVESWSVDVAGEDGALAPPADRARRRRALIPQRLIRQPSRDRIVGRYRITGIEPPVVCEGRLGTAGCNVGGTAGNKGV